MFFHQCQVFYKDDGKQYIQQAVFPCGDGTLFNQTTKTCDYADNVSCDHLIVESIVRYQQTMPIPTSGPSKAKPIPATSFKCSPHEHKNGFYFADEETDCERPVVYAAPPTIDAAYVLENSPFTCHGLIDGHYADISFDCMFFHQCQVFYKDDGQKYIQQAVFPCGEGTLFNQTTKTCDYADNVSCDHLIVESIVRYQQTMPIPTSGPSKAKPIPGTSFKCSPHEHKNGFYFADEETDCEVYHRKMKAAICLMVYLAVSVTGYGFGRKSHLPPYRNDHLQFHPEAILYPAIHKLPAVTTTKRPVYAAPRTIDAAHVLENSPFTCRGLIDGHYADISFDCTFFHQCQVFYKDDGQQYIQQAVFPCGEGTLFNQTTKTCDYAENVSCDHLLVESIVWYQQTLPIPTPGPSMAKPIPATSFRCSPHEHRNGYYFADEETDCKVYHRCIYHIEKEVTYATQFSFMCPEGLLFNQTTIACMDANVVKCYNTQNLWNDQGYLHPLN
ncbi:hypothetical protein GQR58_013754 [Nymphon striatum]|nr:hypothetical protein GQR58_013754 [Nymphon striatum]